jgi:hypothetical protein
MLSWAKYHLRLPTYSSVESLIRLNSVGGYYTEHRLAYEEQASQGSFNGGEGSNCIAAIRSPYYGAATTVIEHDLPSSALTLLQTPSKVTDTRTGSENPCA